MRVEDIQQAIRKAPEEEKKRDEEDWVDKPSTSQKSSFNGAPSRDNSTSGHRSSDFM
jgi:hypothetical protein